LSRTDQADPLLVAVSEAVLAETGDRALADRVVARLREKAASVDQPARRRTGRRAPAVVDPFELYNSGGAALLRERLGQLDIEKVKDIVAQYGMDPNRLAMKWQTTDRLIDHVITTVEARAQKGQAFRQ
jgi:hypothetical protein